jgi:hypothetical protein
LTGGREEGVNLCSSKLVYSQIRGVPPPGHTKERSPQRKVCPKCRIDSIRLGLRIYILLILDVLILIVCYSFILLDILLDIGYFIGYFKINFI